MKKPLAIVTGAHGFIGKRLVATLEQRGYNVTSLPHKFLSVPKKLDKFFHIYPAEYIFHLAAYGNMAYQQNPHKILWGNYIRTFNLLEATKNISYKAFVNVSSSSVQLPHQTLYSATKLGGEALCLAYHSEYKKPIVTVRPYSVYGEGEADFRFIPTVFRSCMLGEKFTLAPTPVHDWVYVQDVVNYMIDAAGKAKEWAGEAKQIGTGIATSNLEVVRMIEAITVRSANMKLTHSLRSFDNTYWKADPWPFYTDLLDGLEKYYRYAQSRLKT